MSVCLYKVVNGFDYVGALQFKSKITKQNTNTYLIITCTYLKVEWTHLKGNTLVEVSTLTLTQLE